MKTKYKILIKYLGVTAFGLLVATSCTKYLDVSPQVNITDQDVFGTFKKFQGFIEDIYQCVVDPTLGGAGAEDNWNHGLDEGIMAPADQRMLSTKFEQGNYLAWTQTNYSEFAGQTVTPINAYANSTGGRKGYWGSGWYGIRKANLAIRNIGLMVNATQEERNFILGQAYFFRGYLHYEILRHWAHIPYIDSAYNASDVIQPVPLTYADCAKRIDADLRTAVDLLPANWDNTTVGQVTATKNAIRATKGAAWAVIGMNALNAGSPLMASDVTSPNAPDSTKYDTDWCKIAAEAYGEVLKLAVPGIAGGDGSGGYDLETWENYHYNFYSYQSGGAHPGGITQTGKEIIWTYPNTQSKRWNYGDMYIEYMGAWGTYYSPTANYVENFGMKSGLPLADPASGYNPARPWDNRDPRFYYNIVKDSDRLVVNPPASASQYTWVQYFVGGAERNGDNSVTGYGYKKYYGRQCNQYDNKWGGTYYYDVNIERLAGVLLEYAEVVNEAYGPTGKSLNCPLTAIDAVNKVRNRVRVGPYTNTYPDLYDFQVGGTPLPNIDPKYTASKEIFRQAIRNERNVELAFEMKRWHDTRRWGIASDLKWRQKFQLDFDQAHTYFNKVLQVTSVFEPKHWWLPFKPKDAALYPAFKQNPGW